VQGASPGCGIGARALRDAAKHETPAAHTFSRRSIHGMSWSANRKLANISRDQLGYFDRGLQALVPRRFDGSDHISSDLRDYFAVTSLFRCCRAEREYCTHVIKPDCLQILDSSSFSAFFDLDGVLAEFEDDPCLTACYSEARIARRNRLLSRSLVRGQANTTLFAQPLEMADGRHWHACVASASRAGHELGAAPDVLMPVPGWSLLPVNAQAALEIWLIGILS
jgi:hypothetical protein